MTTVKSHRRLAACSAAQAEGRSEPAMDASARLLSDVQQITEAGRLAMARIGETLEDIQGQAQESQEIVRTIDLFATELRILALNARCEAVRAGAAGKAFNVVAEAVGRLAARSGEAAKSTASLIGASGRSADRGVEVGAQISKSLDSVAATLSTSSSAILHKNRIEGFVENACSDLRFLVTTPPVQGIFRALANGGLDPIDGSRVDVWRKRLSVIFSGLMEAKKHYKRMRFLVNGNEEAVAVALARGQAVVSDFMPVFGQGAMQRSEVEHVRIGELEFDNDGAGYVTLNLALSISSQTSHHFGTISVDVDAAAFLDPLRDVEGKLEYRLVLPNGSYAVHPAQGWTIQESRFARGLKHEFPAEQQSLVSGESCLLEDSPIGPTACIPISVGSGRPFDWILIVSHPEPGLAAAS